MKKTQLLAMYLGSFVAMFLTMYVMVAQWNHVFININKIYMALLMVAAMGIVNSLVMAQMYASATIRWTVLGTSILATLALVGIIRAQLWVNDTAFLESMIPHHSSAILMCQQAHISDPEIQDLCTEIVKTQEEEIAVMRAMLTEKN